MPLTGGTIEGSLHVTEDISATQHGLIGKNVDFNEGGPYTFAVGHDHHFYGKESFIAGNEGNIVGAKGFYWKAIDTDEKKIYLTKNRLFWDNRCKPITNGNSSNHGYDVPYFGKKN